MNVLQVECGGGGVMDVFAPSVTLSAPACLTAHEEEDDDEEEQWLLAVGCAAHAGPFVESCRGREERSRAGPQTAIEIIPLLLFPCASESPFCQQFCCPIPLGNTRRFFSSCLLLLSLLC